MSLPRLQRAIIGPNDDRLMDLPEKAVQFGTGAFLRGFIESFIDNANRRGAFKGRIVAIGSTGSGRDNKINEQDGLYTLAMRGIANGAPHSEYQLITSLNRALSANDQWSEVLACARNPSIEIIFSNTTEAGIRLDDADFADSPERHVPRSFPAKLTRFLYERARAFDFAGERGVVVVPCELIEDNGAVLKGLVLETARRWSLDERFDAWIERYVPFCNTLVDRIVPGQPEASELKAAWQDLGYRDEMLTACEIYRLLAIEADTKTAARLTFAHGNTDIIIADDITPYRERKIRLLNGTHTIMVPAALLAGCEIVSEAVQDDQVGPFIHRVLFGELVPSTDVADAEEFAGQVIDRFSNPFIRHALVDITLQQTMKMRLRIIPAIIDYVAAIGRVPASLALGFAAFLLYVRDVRADERVDESAGRIRALWRKSNEGDIASVVCGDASLWGYDLNQDAPGFAEAVGEYVVAIGKSGIRPVLEQHLAAQQRA
ncbi:MAG TPA: tagaturonate reductase [Longimicrobiales bacterium]|nr:tagaturonate reductase [Longimicrobiales bacterium]